MMLVSEGAIMRQRQRQYETYQIQEIRIRDYTKQKKNEKYCRRKRSSNAINAMQCQVVTPVVEKVKRRSSVDRAALSPSVVEDSTEATVIGVCVDSCASASADGGDSFCACGSAAGVGSRGPV